MKAGGVLQAKALFLACAKQPTGATEPGAEEPNRDGGPGCRICSVFRDYDRRRW